MPHTLSQPLAKRINQKFIERWAASYWRLPRRPPAHSAQDDKDRPFVMMFPPPNITGNLHLGHALTGAIQDALIRQRRMLGFDCHFIPGFDHAGLATQNIVEKILWRQKKQTRQQLGREQFTHLVDEWKDKKRSEMRHQLDRLGLDLNHDKEYFTMDEKSSLAVKTAFVRLFESNIIYRSTKPIFWSNQLQTTLSDIEVEQVDGVNRFFRTGEIVEKRSLSQWFIDAKELAERAVDVIENSSISMIPPNYKRSWSSWLVGNGVEDWCISRQSWWGHRIPAYKLHSSQDVKSNWIVAESTEDAKKILNSENDDIIQDPDVLDTWFSSSLLPLTISGWPNKEIFDESCLLQRFPIHLMETGFDILTFWVSKMVMMSLALTNQVPFKTVLLHGMICDSDGKKMSKSRGNVIDPLDVIDGTSLREMQNRAIESNAEGIIDDRQIEDILKNLERLFPKGIPECGADGLRAYLLSHDVQEQVVRVRIEQIEKIRRLSNKVWNMFRFLLNAIDRSHVDKKSIVATSGQFDKENLDDSDKEILAQLCECVVAAQESFHETFQLQHCFNKLEFFLVEHLSQQYIGKVKDAIFKKEGIDKAGEQRLRVLVTCLMTSMKLLHPFMPHITEFLYQKLTLDDEDIEQLEKTPIKLLSHEKFPSPDEINKYIP